ncbi:MAG: AbrB/MazE/SpoVT family DNA-binding domain-containing protein [Thaumarchaeota archaeon]|nr:AbrB/MazE/SpoVT family DNA-binding domain-containing protein [Nitrososphaerota archaeon]
MTETIVTVTKKGQATIPVDLRRKHKIGRKVIVVDTEAGVLFKAVPDPMMEKGSLRELFQGASSRELIDQARAVEYGRDRAARRR